MVDRMIKLELASLRTKFEIRNLLKTKAKKRRPRVHRKVKVPRGIYHKSEEELLKLLVNFNVIKRKEPAKLCDFVGDYNLMDKEEKLAGIHPDQPSYGQIKEVVVMNIAVPLGS